MRDNLNKALHYLETAAKILTIVARAGNEVMNLKKGD